MNQYLIPANAKKSLLIFGLFRVIDIILFGIGLVITLICMLFINLDNIWAAIGALTPALVTGFLVAPVPNYHNILTFFTSFFKYLTERRMFVWKGWCYQDGQEK